MSHTYNTRLQVKQQEQEQAQAQTLPHVDPVRMRHRYATRLERNRIQAVVIERDIAIVTDLLTKVDSSPRMLNRLKACIELYTYLLQHQMLFRIQSFKEITLNKMREIEKGCYKRLLCINSIEHREKFKKRRALRKYMYKLVNIINKIRGYIRV